MLERLRVSPGFLLLVACSIIAPPPLYSEALQVPSGSDAGIATNAQPEDSRALYRALNELRPDGTRVFAVHDLNVRRDVISLTFSEGKLAFLPAIEGHVTGAVFTGRGRVLAPPAAKRSAERLGIPVRQPARPPMRSALAATSATRPSPICRSSTAPS